MSRLVMGSRTIGLCAVEERVVGLVSARLTALEYTGQEPIVVALVEGARSAHGHEAVSAVEGGVKDVHLR